MTRIKNGLKKNKEGWKMGRLIRIPGKYAPLKKIETTDYTDYTDFFYFFIICVNLCNLWAVFPAPEKLIHIDGGRQMRRRIEVFQGFVNTSFFFLDPLFSSLPLLSANCIIAVDLQKTKKIETTDYTDFFISFISVISVISVAKKIYYKEDQYVGITSECLILAFKSSGTRPERRKVHGLNGTIVFTTVSGNGYGQRFIYYQKINGFTSFSILF
jgi:hypothetical protein